MYRVIENGTEASTVDTLSGAIEVANARLTGWPAPFNDMRNHHQFDSFKRYGVDRLAVQSAGQDVTVEIQRAWE